MSAIPAGYKQTEVGVIPSDWTVVSVGELARFTSGIGISVAALRAKSSDVSVPVYGGNGIAGYTTILNISGACVVVGRVGQRCGEVYLTDGPAWITDNALYPKDTYRLFDTPFLAYALKAAKLNEVKNKNDLPLVTQAILAAVRIAWPEIDEQRAIAAVLSDVDALLAKLDQFIAKRRDLKQAAMQQLLTGQTRLPGYSGAWEVKRLGEVGRCFAGGTPSTIRSDYWGGNIFWLPSGRVQNKILKAPADSEITITQRGLDESATKKIKTHSVLVAITGATCANIAMLEFETAANQSVVAIEPLPTTDYKFLYYSLLMERGQILSLQNGSAQGGVNLKTVKSIQFGSPPLPEQTAIAAVLSDMDAELAALEARRDKTRALKQGMMQELLTGRIRLV